MQKIKITHEGKSYTLAFDREAVKYGEKKKDFYISEMNTASISFYSTLFNLAFYKHHGIIGEKFTDEIWKNIIEGKDELVSALIDMYMEAINDFLETPKDVSEDSAKNTHWEIA